MMTGNIGRSLWLHQLNECRGRAISEYHVSDKEFVGCIPSVSESVQDVCGFQ